VIENGGLPVTNPTLKLVVRLSMKNNTHEKQDDPHTMSHIMQRRAFVLAVEHVRLGLKGSPRVRKPEQHLSIGLDWIALDKHRKEGKKQNVVYWSSQLDHTVNFPLRE